MTRRKLSCTKNNTLLEFLYLNRLFSRSIKGKKFLAIIRNVNNREIHFLLGQKKEETSSIKIIIVEVQCRIIKASIYLSFSF